MNDPDTPDRRDTDPFNFEFRCGHNTLTIEAKISMGAVEIIGCQLGHESFDIDCLAMRQFRDFEYRPLDELIADEALNYLESVR